jgi:hypothetical protein
MIAAISIHDIAVDGKTRPLEGSMSFVRISSSHRR